MGEEIVLYALEDIWYSRVLNRRTSVYIRVFEDGDVLIERTDRNEEDLVFTKEEWQEAVNFVREQLEKGIENANTDS
jgi:hypothetical protein